MIQSLRKIMRNCPLTFKGTVAKSLKQCLEMIWVSGVGGGWAKRSFLAEMELESNEYSKARLEFNAYNELALSVIQSRGGSRVPRYSSYLFL